MSFSYEQKKEIIEHVYRSSCCRRSLLCGILFAKGSCEGKSVKVTLEKVEYADFCSKLIKEFYGQDPSVYRSPRGGRNINLSFDSPSASKYLSEIDAVVDPTIVDLIKQKCASCLSSFLRGVFLASGRVSDPKKQYSLEFTLNDRAGAFAKILTDLSFQPLISDKDNKSTVYFRRGEEIENFYGYAGLNHAVLFYSPDLFLTKNTPPFHIK